MAVNINRNVDDTFYRYKMPKLLAKVTPQQIVHLKTTYLKCYFPNIFQVEGKGNGIKTVIANMVDIAKALNRPPTCKFSL